MYVSSYMYTYHMICSTDSCPLHLYTGAHPWPREALLLYAHQLPEERPRTKGVSSSLHCVCLLHSSLSNSTCMHISVDPLIVCVCTEDHHCALIHVCTLL